MNINIRYYSFVYFSEGLMETAFDIINKEFILGNRINDCSGILLDF